MQRGRGHGAQREQAENAVRGNPGEDEVLQAATADKEQSGSTEHDNSPCQRRPFGWVDDDEFVADGGDDESGDHCQMDVPRPTGHSRGDNARGEG